MEVLFFSLLVWFLFLLGLSELAILDVINPFYHYLFLLSRVFYCPLLFLDGAIFYFVHFRFFFVCLACDSGVFFSLHIQNKNGFFIFIFLELLLNLLLFSSFLVTRAM